MQVQDLARLVNDQAKLAAEAPYVADALEEDIQTIRRQLTDQGMSDAQIDAEVRERVKSLSATVVLTPSASSVKELKDNADENRRTLIAADVLSKIPKNMSLVGYIRSAPDERLSEYVFALARAKHLGAELGLIETYQTEIDWDVTYFIDAKKVTFREWLFEKCGKHCSPEAMTDLLSFTGFRPDVEAVTAMVLRPEMHPLLLEIYEMHPEWMKRQVISNEVVFREPFYKSPLGRFPLLLKGFLKRGLPIDLAVATQIIDARNVECRDLAIKQGYDFFDLDPKNSVFWDLMQTLDVEALRFLLDGNPPIAGRPILTKFAEQFLPALRLSRAPFIHKARIDYKKRMETDPEEFHEDARQIFELLKSQGAI